jgi:hypothetical protein
MCKLGYLNSVYVNIFTLTAIFTYITIANTILYGIDTLFKSWMNGMYVCIKSRFINSVQ